MALGSHATAGGALSPEVSPTWGLSSGTGSEQGLPHTLHTATGTLFVSRLPRAARCQFLSGRGKQGQGADLTATPAREQRCAPHTPPARASQSFSPQAGLSWAPHLTLTLEEGHQRPEDDGWEPVPGRFPGLESMSPATKATYWESQCETQPPILLSRTFCLLLPQPQEI